MEQFTEFVANHLFLFSLLISLVSLLLWNFYSGILTADKQLSTNDAIYQINHKNAYLIDLRTQNNFTTGHIIGALNYPKNELSNSLSKIEQYQQKPIIFYCQNGTESTAALKMLKEKKLPELYILKGGFTAWRQANLPVEKN